MISEYLPSPSTSNVAPSKFIMKKQTTMKSARCRTDSGPASTAAAADPEWNSTNNVEHPTTPINIDTNLDSYIASAKITGSKNQDKYEEYKKINIRFRDDNLDIIQLKFNAIKNNNTKAIDSLNLKQENITKRKYLFATNFAINNSDYEVAPYIALSDIYDINIKYLDTIQKSMSPKVAQSLYGKKLTEYVTKIKKQQ